MDMSLPGIDGWEATRRISGAADAEHPGDRADRARDVDDREKAMEAGCDDYDTKPVELPRLLSKIQALLGTGGRREHPSRRARPPASRAADSAEPHHRVQRDAAPGRGEKRRPRSGPGLAKVHENAQRLLTVINQLAHAEPVIDPAPRP